MSKPTEEPSKTNRPRLNIRVDDLTHYDLGRIAAHHRKSRQQLVEEWVTEKVEQARRDLKLPPPPADFAAA